MHNTPARYFRLAYILLTLPPVSDSSVFLGKASMNDSLLFGYFFNKRNSYLCEKRILPFISRKVIVKTIVRGKCFFPKLKLNFFQLHVVFVCCVTITIIVNDSTPVCGCFLNALSCYYNSNVSVVWVIE